jgi:hypothetical protein
MTALYPQGPARPANAASTGALDTALRVVGCVVAVVLAAVTAVIEIFFTPLRVGGVLIGVSAVAAVIINYVLVRYTAAVTGRRWTALLPALVWFGLVMAAAGRRPEGDLLLAQANWVALLMIFAGSLAFAAAGYRMIVAPPPPPPPPSPPPPPAAPEAAPAPGRNIGALG